MRTKHVAVRPPRSNSKSRSKSKSKSKSKSEEPISISSESAGDADIEMASSTRHSDRKRKSTPASSQQQRVWSDEATEALLRGMIDYRSKTGSIPSTATMADFFEYIRYSLPPEITKDQVYNKVRHLRDRYYTNGGTYVHSSVVQHLMSKIWSTGNNKNNETDDGDPSNGDGIVRDVNLGLQLNDGPSVVGGEIGGGDGEVNIVSNSPKSTPKKKNKRAAVQEDNHEIAPESTPKKKQKEAAKEDDRDELDGNNPSGKQITGEQIPAEKSNNNKKQKKVNKATSTNTAYNFLQKEIEEDKRKANTSREKEIQESVLCNNYPCTRDAIKEVCRTGGFESSLMAEVLRRIGVKKFEALEKKYESHWATEMKLRAELMELNSELHRLLSSSVNRK